VFAAGLLCGAFIGKVPPALPALRADFGLTLVEAGYIATMLNVLGGSVGMSAGVFSDRFGHKRIALGGLALLAAGGALGALAGSYPVILAARFLEGTGFIMTTVAGAALTAQATALADRSKAMALWSCYMPAGGSLAMLAASAALVLSGWRELWLTLAAAAAACFLLLARTVPAPRPHAPVALARLALESLAHPATLFLCLVFAGYTAQWAVFLTWLPTFVVGERGGSAGLGSLLTALWVGINVPGVLLGGWLIVRGARRSRVIAAASIVQALAGAGALLELLPDAGRYASCLAFSFFGGVIPAAVFSGVAALARSPQHIGTANGMAMQLSQLSQFLSPIAVAWLVTRAGWSASLPVMLACAALAFGGACGIALQERRAAAAR